MVSIKPGHTNHDLAVKNLMQKSDQERFLVLTIEDSLLITDKVTSKNQ